MSEAINPPPRLLAAVEIAANRYLGSDARALARCRALTGRTLALHVTDWSLAVCVVAVDHGVQIRRWDDEAAFDVALTGPANAFVHVAKRADAGAIGASGLKIEGDIGVAQGFAELAGNIDFETADWVDAHFGPLAASVFERGWRAGRGLARRINHELPAQLREYLVDEIGVAASRAEVEDFAVRTTELRNATDRLAERAGRYSTAR